MPEDNATPAAPAEDLVREIARLKHLIEMQKNAIRDFQDRNRFAIVLAALPAVVESALAHGITWHRTPEEIAVAVNVIADAMMAERAKGGGQ